MLQAATCSGYNLLFYLLDVNKSYFCIIMIWLQKPETKKKVK